MIHIIIILLFIQSTVATHVDKCPTGNLPLAVRVNNCDKPPCILRHGTNVTLEVDFEVLRYEKMIEAQAEAFSLGAKVNYILPDNNVCDSLTNGECPLDAGEVVTYLLTLPISDAFPSVPVVIDFSLVGNSSRICCFSVNCQVA